MTLVLDPREAGLVANDGKAVQAALRRFTKTITRGLWVAPIVIALILTTVYPTIFLIALSLSKSSLGSPFRTFVGVMQFVKVLGDPVFLIAVLRSVVYAFVASTLQLIAGFAIALLFTSLLKGGRLLMSFVLLPLMTPPVMVGVSWKLILAPAGGVLNGWLLKAGLIDQPVSFLGSATLAWFSVGIADLWQWTPFIVILCFAALTTLPAGIIEAAMIDGASPWQRLRHVILPTIAAPLSSIFLLKLIIAFKLFDLVYVLTFGGPGFDTTTAGFAIWKLGLQEFDVARAAAETLVYALVLGIVAMPVLKLHAKLEAHDT
jgi:multiple sugar transport system permease protein